MLLASAAGGQMNVVNLEFANVHAAAPILMSAFLVLTLALLALLGLMILRPQRPRETRQPPLALQPIVLRTTPVRRRPCWPIEFGGEAGHPLRAPPTFPDQRRAHDPAEFPRE
jgi:hypothetical protein